MKYADCFEMAHRISSNLKSVEHITSIRDGKKVTIRVDSETDLNNVVCRTDNYKAVDIGRLELDELEWNLVATERLLRRLKLYRDKALVVKHKLMYTCKSMNFETGKRFLEDADPYFDEVYMTSKDGGYRVYSSEYFQTVLLMLVDGEPVKEEDECGELRVVDCWETHGKVAKKKGYTVHNRLELLDFLNKKIDEVRYIIREVQNEVE